MFAKPAFPEIHTENPDALPCPKCLTPTIENGPEGVHTCPACATRIIVAAPEVAEVLRIVRGY